MFPSAREVLKAREGALAEQPLPRLLHALTLEERTCVLELKLRQLEKRVLIEEGVPVGLTSNLLHETLGKFLVERKKLTEEQYQQVLTASVTTGQQYGAVLVQQGLITPFELYKQLQANLGHALLDCFRWTDARYRLVPEAPAAQSPIRLNPRQLIFTGITTSLPFDVVASELELGQGQRLAWTQGAAQAAEELKLSPKDTRLFQLLKGRPGFAELIAKSGLELEPAMRRIYAFAVLGLIDLAEKVPEVSAPPPAAVSAPAPAPPPPAPPAGVPFADEDEALKNALATEFLEHRRKDPFDLLGVREDAPAALVRKAFLAKAEQFAPLQFRSAELKERAEALLLAYARAYGALTEPDQLELHRKRRQLAKQAATAPKKDPTEHFRIRTDLLDATSQFAEGQRRLEAGVFRAAIDYFQYAFEIEPKAKYRAYLAWARYQFNPAAHAKLALHELQEAAKSEPGCEEAWAFAGDIQRATGQHQAAEESYRRAFKLNPNQRRYPEAIKELTKTRK